MYYGLVRVKNVGGFINALLQTNIILFLFVPHEHISYWMNEYICIHIRRIIGFRYTESTEGANKSGK